MGDRWRAMLPQPYTIDPEFGREPWKCQGPLAPGERVTVRGTLFTQGYEMTEDGGIIDHHGRLCDARKVYQDCRVHGADWCALALPDGLCEDGGDYTRRYESHRARPASSDVRGIRSEREVQRG